MNPKQNYKLDASGYCLYDEQCFLENKEGLDVCVENGYWEDDHYCENGGWTSRTKLIAMTLLDEAMKADGEYTLFCGPYKDVLNFYD